jgi:plastocyanin
MPEEQPENIIDQFWHVVQQLLLPNWSDLILLLPWVLMGLVLLWLVFTAFQWRSAAKINRSRVPPRLAGGSPPAGIHLPGPSRWPFVVPIGVVFLLFALALPPRDAQGNPTATFNTALLVIGLVISFVAVTGWLWDAMREWRSTDQGGHAALVVAAGDVAVLHGGGGSALIPAGRSEVALAEQELHPAEPPPGVHMPGPSPWPFFLPIAVTVMLFGLVFSSALIAGGLILALIGVGSWLRDALKEYDSTEEVGYAVPETRDPEKAWPKRLVPIFAVVIAISFLIALAPLGLSYINSLTPPSAGPTAVAVPAVPEISASTAVSFDTTTLIVPAGRPFDLKFDNKQAGVPHNVQIDDSPAKTTIIFNGEHITGPATITYNVPAIAEGNYYFLCEVHPNMNGTLVAQPESGPPPAPGPGGPPGPGGSGEPGGSGGPSGPASGSPSGASPQP